MDRLHWRRGRRRQKVDGNIFFAVDFDASVDGTLSRLSLIVGYNFQPMQGLYFYSIYIARPKTIRNSRNALSLHMLYS